MSDLGVSIQFNLVDRLTGGMRNIQASVGRVSEAFKTTAKSAADLDKEMEKVDKRMQNAAFLSLAAGRIEQNASRMRGAVRQNIEAIRPLESAMGALRSVGVENLDFVKQTGIDMQREFAGITSAVFVDAAYSTKGAINSLSDEAVAAVTKSAAITAIATKAPIQQMTSLFGTAYGIFKRMDAEMSDEDWSKKFSAGLAAAVNVFKTTGPEMQMAIERAGSEMTLLGSTLEEQLTMLGMLQTSLPDAVAGTAFKMFTSQAYEAQQAFDKLGYSIDLIDAEGKLMPMAEFLRSLQNEFGGEYTAEVGNIIKDAFGTDDAKKVIANLWGMADAFEANQKAIEKATKQGIGYTSQMAKLMDSNFDSLLKIHAQRWDLVRQATGDAMKPLLTALLPVTELFARMAEAVMRVPILGPTIGVIVLGLVGLVSTLGALGSTMAGLYGTFAIISQAQLLMHTRNITLIGGFRALGSTMAGGLLKGLRFAVVGLWQVAAAGWAAIAPFWPIIAVVAAVAGAAFLIVKFWQPISGFFVKLLGGIKAGIVTLWNATSDNPFFNPVGFIIKRWKPIIEFFEGMWKRIGGIIEKVGGWFGHAARPAMAGAMAGAAVASAPMSSPASMGNITPIEKTISEARVNSSSSLVAPITIHAAPGQNPEQIASAVTRELDARQRANASRMRSRLHD